jgi:hypothetical protein
MISKHQSASQYQSAHQYAMSKHKEMTKQAVQTTSNIFLMHWWADELGNEKLNY